VGRRKSFSYPFEKTPRNNIVGGLRLRHPSPCRASGGRPSCTAGRRMSPEAPEERWETLVTLFTRLADRRHRIVRRLGLINDPASCASTSRGGPPNANEGRRQKGLAPRVEKLKQSNPNPPAHNAYATTPQPANPVRHAAIHSSMIPSQTICRLVGQTRCASPLA